MTLVYSIYFLTIVVMLFGSFNTLSVEELDGNHKRQKGYLIFLWLLYSVILGSRAGFVDTSTYRHMAEKIGSDFINLFDQSKAIVEPGFNLFMILCNKISSDTQFFVFITSMITFAGVFVWIYKKSTDKMLSLFMFITLHMFTYINGIRQAIVAVIFALLYDKWKDNKWWLIITCLVLSLFHNSALLLIPICLCVYGKPFNWKIKCVFAFSLFCLIAPGAVQNLLSFFLSERYQETLTMSTRGTGIIRVLLNSVPAISAVIYYYAKQHTNQKMTKSETIMFNILLIDLAIGICSLRSTYFARMSIYFSLFTIIYFPYLLQKIFNRRSYLPSCLISGAVYTAFFLYQAYAYNNYGYLDSFYLFFLK